MEEETNKKPDEAKKPEQENAKRETIKVERDKNGRFIKQNKGNEAPKKDDNTVKIKIVSGKTESPNKADKAEEKNTDNKKKQEKKPSNGTVTFVGIPVGWWNWKWADSLHDALWERHDRMMDEMDRMFDSAFDRCSKSFDTSLDSFAKKVSDIKPDTITINGRKYYSEENVAHKVADTIGTCAKIATDEIAKNAATCGGNCAKPEVPQTTPAPTQAAPAPKTEPEGECPEKQDKAQSPEPDQTAKKLSKVCANLIMVAVIALTAIGVATVIRWLFF